METKAVEHAGAFVLCNADGNHFRKAALMRSAEIRVRFYFIENHDSIGFVSILVTVKWKAFSPHCAHLFSLQIIIGQTICIVIFLFILSFAASYVTIILIQ